MNLEKMLDKEYFLEILSKAADLTVDAVVVDIGIMDYSKIFPIEGEIARIKVENPQYKDLILFMEHPPSIDFGRKPENNLFSHPELQEIDPYNSLEKAKSIILKYGINFNISQRAGGPAYLGPGQLNIHPIVNCKKANIGQNGSGTPDGQHKLDLIMKRIAEIFGITDVLVKNHLDDSDKRDVYLPAGNFSTSGKLGTKLGSKIAAFTSLSFSTNVMYNGFSFFLNRDATKGFNFIPACGYSSEELAVASLQEVLEERGVRKGEISLEEAKEAALRAIKEVFKYKNGIALYNPKSKTFTLQKEEVLI